MSALSFELRWYALQKRPPSARFWEVPWHVQDAITDAKNFDEHWYGLRPNERRMFLLFIACAIEGGDL